MESLLFLIIIIISAITVIANKVRHVKMTQEEKELYKSGVEKLGNVDKNRKLLFCIGIAIYVLIIAIYLITTFSSNKVIAVDLGDNPKGLSGVMEIYSVWSDVIQITELYIIFYAIVRILFELIYIRKQIKKNEKITEEERNVLTRHYTTSIFASIGWGILLEVPVFIAEVLNNVAAKPIIYIYPEEKKKVTLRLGNPENLTHTYPEYKDGWDVEADVDGTLTDINGKKYYSLYWEGINKVGVNQKIGFCVKGEDTASFLEEKLELLGLNYKERQEFIVYWLPQMENNKYNYIYFMQTNEVDSIMPIEITPKPESLIRIMMYFKPLMFKETKIEEQIFKPVERQGYTVVEWGGTKIR